MNMSYKIKCGCRGGVGGRRGGRRGRREGSGRQV